MKKLQYVALAILLMFSLSFVNDGVRGYVMGSLSELIEGEVSLENIDEILEESRTVSRESLSLDLDCSEMRNYIFTLQSILDDLRSSLGKETKGLSAQEKILESIANKPGQDTQVNQLRAVGVLNKKGTLLVLSRKLSQVSLEINGAIENLREKLRRPPCVPPKTSFGTPPNVTTLPLQTPPSPQQPPTDEKNPPSEKSQLEVIIPNYEDYSCEELEALRNRILKLLSQYRSDFVDFTLNPGELPPQKAVTVNTSVGEEAINVTFGADSGSSYKDYLQRAMEALEPHVRSIRLLMLAKCTKPAPDNTSPPRPEEYCGDGVLQTAKPVINYLGESMGAGLTEQCETAGTLNGQASDGNLTCNGGYCNSRCQCDRPAGLVPAPEDQSTPTNSQPVTASISLPTTSEQKSNTIVVAAAVTKVNEQSEDECPDKAIFDLLVGFSYPTYNNPPPLTINNPEEGIGNPVDSLDVEDHSPGISPVCFNGKKYRVFINAFNGSRYIDYNDERFPYEDTFELSEGECTL